MAGIHTHCWATTGHPLHHARSVRVKVRTAGWPTLPARNGVYVSTEVTNVRASVRLSVSLLPAPPPPLPPQLLCVHVCVCMCASGRGVCVSACARGSYTHTPTASPRHTHTNPLTYILTTWGATAA